MRSVRPLVVAVLVSVVLAVPAVVLADGRVALVVGNSTYAHIGRLPNPDNDARDMSSVLRRFGFESGLRDAQLLPASFLSAGVRTGPPHPVGLDLVLNKLSPAGGDRRCRAGWRCAGRRPTRT